MIVGIYIANMVSRVILMYEVMKCGQSHTFAQFIFKYDFSFNTLLILLCT